MKNKNNNETLLDTATFNITNTEMSESHAVDIMKHLIKNKYKITRFSNVKDSLMDNPQWTIRAEREMVVFPESSQFKVDDLIEIFNNAYKILIEKGGVNIFIDQSVGGIDIDISPKNLKKE